jgi:hypothetical protein
MTQIFRTLKGSRYIFRNDRFEFLKDEEPRIGFQLDEADDDEADSEDYLVNPDFYITG